MVEILEPRKDDGKQASSRWVWLVGFVVCLGAVYFWVESPDQQDEAVSQQSVENIPAADAIGNTSEVDTSVPENSVKVAESVEQPVIKDENLQVEPQSSSPSVDTWCSRDEVQVFSCRVTNGKVLSVCASSDLSATNGYLQYRFGKLGKAELFYPAQLVPPADNFTMGSVMYNAGGAAYLRFIRKPFEYTVYSGGGKGWDQAGVVVHQGETIVANIICDGLYESELSVGDGYLESVGMVKDQSGLFEVP